MDIRQTPGKANVLWGKPSGQGFGGLCCGPNLSLPCCESSEAVCPHLTTWPLPPSCFLAVGFNHPHPGSPLSLTDPFKVSSAQNKSISLSHLIHLGKVGEPIWKAWRGSRNEWKVEIYFRIVSGNTWLQFCCPLFLLPPSPSFISLSLLFSFLLSSLSILSLQKIVGKAAGAFSVFHICFWWAYWLAFK